MSFWDWPYGEGWEPLSFIDQEIVAPSTIFSASNAAAVSVVMTPLRTGAIDAGKENERCGA